MHRSSCLEATLHLGVPLVLQVVLEKDVASMGRAGELLTVSPGHYRNHLLVC